MRSYDRPPASPSGAIFISERCEADSVKVGSVKECQLSALDHATWYRYSGTTAHAQKHT